METIKKLNKNVSVWRGDKIPPTNYHVWIKPDGNIYIYNGTYWEISNNELYIAIQNEITRAINAEVIARETAIADEKERAEQTEANLQAAIDQVVADAKSYTVTKVKDDELSNLGTTVKEAFKLVDEDGVKCGEYIKIYKDSSLKSVALDDQTLNFTYILADGTESIVKLDVSTFLAEAEHGDGLQVNEAGVVSVKRDETSEAFLSVSAEGIKVAGVQDALSNTKDESIQEATILIDNSWSWYEA